MPNLTQTQIAQSTTQNEKPTQSRETGILGIICILVAGIQAIYSTFALAASILAGILGFAITMALAGFAIVLPKIITVPFPHAAAGMIAMVGMGYSLTLLCLGLRCLSCKAISLPEVIVGVVFSLLMAIIHISCECPALAAVYGLIAATFVCAVFSDTHEVADAQNNHANIDTTTASLPMRTASVRKKTIGSLAEAFNL